MAAAGSSPSDHVDEFVEGGGQLQVVTSRVGAELVVASSEVLHEGMASDDRGSCALRPEVTHRSEPGLESPVVGLDAIVGIAIRDRQGVREHVVNGSQERLRLVGHHLDGPRVIGQGTVEEPASRLSVAPPGHVRVDDWPYRSTAR